MAPTGSQLSQSITSCDVAPVSATIEITPTALTSVQRTLEMSKSVVSVEETRCVSQAITVSP